MVEGVVGVEENYDDRFRLPSGFLAFHIDISSSKSCANKSRFYSVRASQLVSSALY